MSDCPGSPPLCVSRGSQQEAQTPCRAEGDLQQPDVRVHLGPAAYVVLAPGQYIPRAGSLALVRASDLQEGDRVWVRGRVGVVGRV
jgi:hypothetical protein